MLGLSVYHMDNPSVLVMLSEVYKCKHLIAIVLLYRQLPASLLRHCFYFYFQDIVEYCGILDIPQLIIPPSQHTKVLAQKNAQTFSLVIVFKIMCVTYCLTDSDSHSSVLHSRNSLKVVLKPLYQCPF